MKIDVINGFEHFIFEKNEIEQAHAKLAEGVPYHRVSIATTCAECGGYIEKSVDQVGPVRHNDAYHASMNY